MIPSSPIQSDHRTPTVWNVLLNFPFHSRLVSVRFYWFWAAHTHERTCGSDNIHTAWSIEADGKFEWSVL